MNKFNAKWLKKYRELLGRMDKQKWIVCILFGVLLLVIAIPVEPKEQKTKRQEIRQEMSEAAETEIEQRVKHLLEQIDGVGKVEVMIYTNTASEKGQWTTQKEPEVQGICVVAEGANNNNTRLKIYEAVQALFPIEPHKISIVEMGVQEGT